MVGVATAQTPCGPYNYKSSFQPLGADLRDESSPRCRTDGVPPLHVRNNQNLKIAQLDGNYYNVTAVTNELTAATLKTSGIVKATVCEYFLITSHTSGWALNPNKWFFTSSLVETWLAQQDIAPMATCPWYSHNALDLPHGTGTAVYMGNRWWPNLLGAAPTSGNCSTSRAAHRHSCTPTCGLSTSRRARVRGRTPTTLSSSIFPGGEAAGYLGHGGTVTINNAKNTGGAHQVTLYFTNGNSMYCNVTVRHPA
ncbi:glycoside hydrolase family 43 protein [Phlebiopsis gigantea 11061_1 CR5-6]|uniref:Glycoside hydrolase family 43 protein n=1 Tax=Phlebiopsis gigantea (strain 11061_1 CR5-6) TaxID=745531 RepID=A0A0C3RZT9_PHLG1|nr:glycoside hydrolase family 43 protein [Phlebiopsis gigantea 11061_1 CR5-6]